MRSAETPPLPFCGDREAAAATTVEVASCGTTAATRRGSTRRRIAPMVQQQQRKRDERRESGKSTRQKMQKCGGSSEPALKPTILNFGPYGVRRTTRHPRFPGSSSSSFSSSSFALIYIQDNQPLRCFYYYYLAPLVAFSGKSKLQPRHQHWHRHARPRAQEGRNR